MAPLVKAPAFAKASAKSRGENIRWLNKASGVFGFKKKTMEIVISNFVVKLQYLSYGIAALHPLVH